MGNSRKHDEIDPAKIIEEMRQEYWRGVSEAEVHTEQNRVQLLLVEMVGEPFAMRAVNCKTILKMGRLTRVPRVPDYVLGVINLRGEIVTVLDAARLLGLAPIAPTDKSRLVLVECDDVRVIFLVDRVRGIEWVDESRIKEPESRSSRLKDDLMRGHVAPLEGEDEWVTFLDLDKIVHDKELSSFQ